jgi:hypothetical protein
MTHLVLKATCIDNQNEGLLTDRENPSNHILIYKPEDKIKHYGSYINGNTKRDRIPKIKTIILFEKIIQISFNKWKNLE